MNPFKRKRLVFVGISLFILLSIAFLLFLSVKKPSIESRLGDGSLMLGQQTFGPNVFSPKDVEYAARFQYPEKSASALTTSEQKKVQNFLLEQTIVLEEAKKRNLLTVPEETFSPNKNQLEYNTTYQKAKDLILNDVKHVSVEGVFIWFNVDNPDLAVPISQAKDITRRKMEAIRTDLIEGAITMTQAGERIKQDESLAAFDSIYKTNAYAKYPPRNELQPIDSNLSEEDNTRLWELKTGDISPLLLGLNTMNTEVSPKEGFWAVYHILEKSGSISSYDQWLNEKINAYEKN